MAVIRYNGAIVGTMRPCRYGDHSFSTRAVLTSSEELKKKYRIEKNAELKARKIEMSYFISYVEMKFRRFPEVWQEIQENLMQDRYWNRKDPAYGALQIKQFLEELDAEPEARQVADSLCDGKRFHDWMELTKRFEALKATAGE